MEFATIYPHSHKVQTKLYKIPTFGVNQASFDWGTAIWKCQNLQRNVWPSGRCVGQCPWINSCLSHNLQTRTQSFKVWNQAMAVRKRCKGLKQQDELDWYKAETCQVSSNLDFSVWCTILVFTLYQFSFLHSSFLSLFYCLADHSCRTRRSHFELFGNSNLFRYLFSNRLCKYNVAFCDNNFATHVSKKQTSEASVLCPFCFLVDIGFTVLNFPDKNTGAQNTHAPFFNKNSPGNFSVKIIFPANFQMFLVNKFKVTEKIKNEIVLLCVCTTWCCLLV